MAGMTDEEIGVRILVLEEEHGSEDIWLKKWEPTFSDWTKEERGTCFRRLYEDSMKRVPAYRRFFSIPYPSPDVRKGD